MLISSRKNRHNFVTNDKQQCHLPHSDAMINTSDGRVNVPITGRRVNINKLRSVAVFASLPAFQASLSSFMKMFTEFSFNL